MLSNNNLNPENIVIYLNERLELFSPSHLSLNSAEYSSNELYCADKEGAQCYRAEVVAKESLKAVLDRPAQLLLVLSEIPIDNSACYNKVLATNTKLRYPEHGEEVVPTCHLE